MIMYITYNRSSGNYCYMYNLYNYIYNIIYIIYKEDIYIRVCACVYIHIY